MLTVPRKHRKEVAQLLVEAAEAARPGARLIAELRKQQRILEPQFQKELEKEFADLGHWVAVVSEGQGGLLQEALRDDEGRVLSILRRANLNQWAQEHLKPLFEKQWRRVLDSTVLVLNRNRVPVHLNNDLAQKLLDMGATRIGLLDIEDDTKVALMGILKEARKAGMNPRTAAKLIEDKVPAGKWTKAGPRYRAELIARTETLEASRQSSIGLYEASPVVKEVEAYDGDGDELCAERNGETFTFEEAEQESVETHPNCVLSFGPVV